VKNFFGGNESGNKPIDVFIIPGRKSLPAGFALYRLRKEDGRWRESGMGIDARLYYKKDLKIE